MSVHLYTEPDEKPRDVQTELAEWEQVGARRWQRKMREWEVGKRSS